MNNSDNMPLVVSIVFVYYFSYNYSCSLSLLILTFARKASVHVSD